MTLPVTAPMTASAVLRMHWWSVRIREVGERETAGAGTTAHVHDPRRDGVGDVRDPLPSAQADPGFSDGSRQWIVTAYALAFAALLLLGGRLADFFGRKPAFLIGAAGFAAASALGVSPRAEEHLRGEADHGARVLGARASLPLRSPTCWAST